jgi:hypothetical protein
MIRQIEGVRDEAIAKVEHMKEQLEEKLARAQEEAAYITEQTRKNAAVAAWWSVAAAVGSAGAAILGGYTALGMY